MEPLVYIHADESCLGVQFTDRDSPGGAAALVEHWTGAAWQRRDCWASTPATTNNRMALLSAELPLRLLRRPCRVVFTSDSNYLVLGMRDWVYGWARRGWRRKSGAIENEALWRSLVEVARRHRVEWRWVRGHAGDPRNEYANWLAVKAAREQSASDGLAPSGYEAWLEGKRARGGYLDVLEHAPPDESEFRPAPPLPET
jgi:ribonuclease HI